MICTLPLPPALNHAFRAAISSQGRPYTYKTADAKRWQEEATLLINASRKTKEMILGPVRVVVKLYLKVDRDIDSSHKLLLDTLQVAGVIKNDKQIVELLTTKIRVKVGPRLVIILEDSYVAAR